MSPFRLRHRNGFGELSSRLARPGLILGLVGALAVSGGLKIVFANGVGDNVAQGLNRLKTVAAILDGRSPGERFPGALVNLKHERRLAAQERALPKTRDPSPPATLLSVDPSIIPLPAVAAPFHDMVSGELSWAAPTDLIVQDSRPTALGDPQTVFPIAPPGGVGGVGMIVPPFETAPTGIPPEPTPVPEPSTWLMTIFGFAAIARLMRRERSPRDDLQRRES